MLFATRINIHFDSVKNCYKNVTYTDQIYVILSHFIATVSYIYTRKYRNIHKHFLYSITTYI